MSPEIVRYFDWDFSPAKVIVTPGKGMSAVFKPDEESDWRPTSPTEVLHSGDELTLEVFLERFGDWDLTR